MYRCLLFFVLVLTSCTGPAVPSEPGGAAGAATPSPAHEVQPESPADTHDAHAEAPAAEHTHADAAQAGSHQDHDSKHGGTFFMALDNRHHLEGVLERPGFFRVYLYDDHTRPLPAAQIAGTEATVKWGEQDNAPQIDLKPSADGTTLEAKAPGAVRFPVVLTLTVRFPGMAADARRELFTFPFSHYSHMDPPGSTPHSHASGG